MGARSNSQSQITPLQARLRPPESPSQPAPQSAPGLDEPFILHTHLDQETVASILSADPNAFVTIVIPPDSLENLGNGDAQEHEHQ